jgi:hypothetical protein
MMCVAVSFQHLKAYTSSASDTERLMDSYREKVVQCLVLSKYTKCAPYTLETLILYLHIEYIRSDDSQIEPWMLLGIIIRLALRMGYHRDPSHFPHISPSQGEMRRRTWAVIVQFDAMSSSQVGLPRMITRYETAEPSNLLDEDFHKDIAAIPLSRPNAFQTPIQYVVSKNRLIAVYGMIFDLVTSTKLGVSAYPEVMRLDELLHDTYLSLPEGLHVRSMANSIMDAPDYSYAAYILRLCSKKQSAFSITSICFLQGQMADTIIPDRRVLKRLFNFSSTNGFFTKRHSLVDASLRTGGKSYRLSTQAFSSQAPY